MNFLKQIDTFLNSITMYRLVAGGLAVLAGISVIFGFVGILSFSGAALLVSCILALAVCWAVNTVFAHIFTAPVNPESWIITALIVFFLMTPGVGYSELAALCGASTIAIASKYLLAFRKKHFLNPAAAGAAAFGFFPSTAAVWWVGSMTLLPLTLILGILVVRKIRRFSMVGIYATVSMSILIGYGLFDGVSLWHSVSQLFTSWPLVFFATIMLTEPFTTPPTHHLRLVYGVIIGILFASRFSIGPFHPTPEFALIVGNIFSAFVSVKQRIILRFIEKREIAKSIFEFVFTPDHSLNFKPGQYMEWTLDHPQPDSRGIRRYFTIASSPTESMIHLGVRISDPGSSFKRALMRLERGNVVMTGALSGDFVLPHDSACPLVFVAGGIGITPFRSMVKYLIDRQEKRDITLLYACSTPMDIAYRDILETAEKVVGVRVVYIITDPDGRVEGAVYESGYMTESIIAKYIPDAKMCMWYVSGPNAMVVAYRRLLAGVGVPNHQIKTDYFPGF